MFKLSDSFNGADLRNVVTEAGMFAIRDDRSVNDAKENVRLLKFVVCQRVYQSRRLDKSCQEGWGGEETRE